MAVLIGGSPSTGSSLLRRILNRHSYVFCGSETSLFTKDKLFEDWEKYKGLIFKKSFAGLRNAGWHHLRGVLLDDEYNISFNEINKLLSSTGSFSNFAESFYIQVLKSPGKRIWAEKTPSNVFCFRHFLHSFPDSKVIHTVRKPEDTIASLINRGMHVYDACVIYLLNTTIGLELFDHPDCLTVRYEDLVTNPYRTVTQLCHFLDIPYEESMLDAEQGEKPNDYMKGWNYRETADIGSASIGRFKRLGEKEKQDITQLVKVLRSSLHTELRTIPEATEKLAYQIDSEFSDHTLSFNLKKHMLFDRIKRTFKGSYFNHFNYPVYVEKK